MTYRNPKFSSPGLHLIAFLQYLEIIFQSVFLGGLSYQTPNITQPGFLKIAIFILWSPSLSF